MKKLILSILLLLIATNAFATRTYHPHIRQVDVTFESGDKVMFSTKYNTATVVGIEITSRGGVKYEVPTEALKEIKAPRLETLKITFHDNSVSPYREGSFALSFDHDDSSEAPGVIADAQFFFEDEVYIGGFDEWSNHQRNKENE